MISDNFIQQLRVQPRVPCRTASPVPESWQIGVGLPGALGRDTM